MESRRDIRANSACFVVIDGKTFISIATDEGSVLVELSEQTRKLLTRQMIDYQFRLT